MAGTDFTQKVEVVAGGASWQLDRAIQLACTPVHPFAKGDLVASGSQVGTQVTTSDGEWTAIESHTISFGVTADIIEVEFAFTYRQKSSGATKDIKHKAQARNSGGTWVDLYSEVTRVANAAAWETVTYSGRFKTVANFNEIPFEVRVVIQREDAGENAIGQMFNSSYIAITI